MTPRTMTQEREAKVRRVLAFFPGPKIGSCGTDHLHFALTELDAERAAHAKTLDVLAALVNAACDADEYVAIMDAEAHLKECGR